MRARIPALKLKLGFSFQFSKVRLKLIIPANKKLFRALGKLKDAFRQVLHKISYLIIVQKSGIVYMRFLTIPSWDMGKV